MGQPFFRKQIAAPQNAGGIEGLFDGSHCAPTRFVIEHRQIRAFDFADAVFAGVRNRASVRFFF
jgi:hypothetical protein